MMKKFLLAALFFSCLLTLLTGEAPWPQVWSDALSRFSGTSHTWNPLLDERLPRLLVLLCTGASLAVAGATLQALFQNPLASPSILGISCGGSLFVLFVLLFQWHLNNPYAIPLAAILGCLLTLFFIYRVAKHLEGSSLSNLILVGIALSTLLIAVQGTLLYALRDHWQLIQTFTELESGSTFDRNWGHVHMQLPLTLVGLFGCWTYRQELDLLALGEEEARGLGVEIETIRWRLFLCVALLTGGAIAAVGIIAFFGLVLPHHVRYLFGPRGHHLIPYCIFIGGGTLVMLDLVLRLSGLHFLSIGNVSAILGGLFFMLLLSKWRLREAV